MKTFTPLQLPINIANIATVIRELQKDLLKYNIIETEINGVTKIQHMLNRVPVGWIIIDTDTYEPIRRVDKDENFLILETQNKTKVSILIF